MKRVAFILAVLALGVPVALAANGEPKHEFTKADQARARAITIRASDLGSGWTAKASKSSSNEDKPRCAKYNPDQSDLIETGKFNSPDYSRPDGTFVSSSTGIFRTRVMATTAYTRVAKPGLPACFGELLQKGAGTAITVVSASERSFPRLGDRSNAYRLVASVKSGTTRVPLVVDLVVFTKGRVDVALVFLGVAKPLQDSFEIGLAQRLAARA